MKATDTRKVPAELDANEIAQVSGGRQIYLDGMLVEMSDANIAGLINNGAVRQITVKGVAYPGSQHIEW